MQKFLEYVEALEYDEEPDYSFVRKLFIDGLKKRGVQDNGKSVDFNSGNLGGASSSASSRGVSNTDL